MSDFVWVWGGAYLAGSVPFAFLVGKLVGGIDIRTVGSGNVGATNIGRTLGSRWGITVLILDALKGLLPVLFLPALFVAANSPVFLHLKVVAAIGAILGHMCPFWLGFRGGKGVATALGAVLILAPYPTLAAVVAFALFFGFKRIVSLASILAVAAFGITQLAMLNNQVFSETNWSLSTFAIAVPTLIIWKHRSNIGRLLRGEENAFTSKKTSRKTNNSAGK